MEAVEDCGTFLIPFATFMCRPAHEPMIFDSLKIKNKLMTLLIILSYIFGVHKSVQNITHSELGFEMIEIVTKQFTHNITNIEKNKR